MKQKEIIFGIIELNREIQKSIDNSKSSSKIKKFSLASLLALQNYLESISLLSQKEQSLTSAILCRSLIEFSIDILTIVSPKKDRRIELQIERFLLFDDYDTCNKVIKINNFCQRKLNEDISEIDRKDYEIQKNDTEKQLPELLLKKANYEQRFPRSKEVDSHSYQNYWNGKSLQKRATQIIGGEHVYLYYYASYSKMTHTTAKGMSQAINFADNEIEKTIELTNFLSIMISLILIESVLENLNIKLFKRRLDRLKKFNDMLINPKTSSPDQ